MARLQLAYVRRQQWMAQVQARAIWEVLAEAMEGSGEPGREAPEAMLARFGEVGSGK